MKWIRIVPAAALLGVVVLAEPLCAQGFGVKRQRRTPPTQEQLKERKDTKLAEAWVSNAKWILDYAEAKAEAKKSKKLIFAYFTRSYSP